MEKIEKVEKLQNVQTKVAKQLGLQRFLEQPSFTDKEMEDRCMFQIFGLLKQEISSHLSSLDALFTASVVLEEAELQCDICKFLDDFCLALHQFIHESSQIEEEGGEDEIS